MIDYPLEALYRAAGLSKQAVHQARARHHRFEQALAALVVSMDELRHEHPGCGLEKAYYTLRPDFLGRDRFIALFQQLGYASRPRRRQVRTTCAGLRRFPNLIEGRSFERPGQVWQSDITYVDLGDHFAYLVFLIDIYTKVIVGYRVSDHLRAEANVSALRMALGRYGAPEIHHSDRGGQYGSGGYVALLRSHGVAVSMGRTGRENAFAERINGTIKNEYLVYRAVGDLSSLRREVGRSVRHYNSHRIHNHLGRRTPLGFLESYGQLAVSDRPVVHVPVLSSPHETVNAI